MQPYLSKPHSYGSNPYGKAFWIVMAAFLLEYARPQGWLPFLSGLKLSAIFLVLCFFVYLSSTEKSKILKRPEIKLLFVFIFVMSLGFFFAENPSILVATTTSLFLVIIGFVLPFVVIMNSKARLFLFFKIWTLSLIPIFLYAITHSGRGPGSFLLDENDLAAMFCIGIAFSYYIAISNGMKRSTKYLYLFIAFICVIGVVITSSRGGFLGMLSVFLMILFFTKNGIKNLLKIVLVGTLLSPVVFYFVPDKYIEDMASISDTEDNTRNERLMSWGYGWDMFLANPILGIGAANYPKTVYKYQESSDAFNEGGQRHLWGRQAHSMWFTLIPELGLAGIIVYFSIFSIILSRMREVKATSTEENSLDSCFAKAILVSVISFFTCGVFVSVLYYPQFWHLVAFSSALFNVTQGDNNLPILKSSTV